MKPGKAFTLGLVMAIAVMGAEGGSVDRDCVTVHLQGALGIPPKTLALAEWVTTTIFRDIGVSVNWTLSGSRRTAGACLAIVAEFTSDSLKGIYPHALAYAFPYQDSGTQIHVSDRVVYGVEADLAGMKLGHIMAHEIGHVLEAMCRHSNEGVMKARLSNADLNDLRLRFAPEDAELIHAGLLRKRQRASQAAGNAGIC